MTAGWVAPSVRGRALLHRRLGRDGAEQLAAAGSLADALSTLLPTAYGRELDARMDLVAAEHGVFAAVLWHLRILAGWGPPLAAGPLRLLAGGFEVANVTGHLARLSGLPAPAPYALGSLAGAWPAVAAARTPGEVRSALSRSVWGDPGSDALPAVRLALQLAWARRVVDGVPAAADWAVARTALVLARVLATGARADLTPPAIRDATRLLGPAWQRAATPAELAVSLPHGAAGALRGVAGPERLWVGEARWWAAVDSGGARLVAQPRPGASAGVGVAAQLAADAWRVRAALALAARGGGDLGPVLDAVA